MRTAILVDDSQFQRDSMRKILEDLKFEVIGEAENGAEGLELFNELKPNLVILDITMKELDGRDTLKLVMDSDPNATVVMCTAIGHEDTIIECIKHGAQGYIVKPFTPSKVEETLNNVFSASSA